MKVAFVSTFLPDHCGLATYAARVLPIIEQSAEVQRVRLPYGATFTIRRNVPVVLRSRVDLVHINYEYALYGQNIIPLLLWLRLKRIPVVLTLHSHNSHRWPNRYLNLWINKLAQKVVVHSLETAQSQGYMHIPHGGPDNPYLEETRRGEKVGPIFVHTGFVRENKRLDEIIGLFSRRPDLQLVISGTYHGRKPTSYYRLCRDLFRQNPGNIAWHDRFMSEHELLRVYAKGDVLVLFHSPVRDNYHSGLVSDALASGLPVLAPPLPGLREQIPAGCGHIMAGFDTPALESALDYAKAHYREWQETLASLRTNFLWENIASQYIRIYQELLSD
jgi:glycosyltransferase involved in cell wall biosynthesis